jgi:non-specific serine/threonine protein kinase
LSTAARAWLTALHGGDPRIQATVAGVAELREVLVGWQPSAAVQRSAARTCFRLIEPFDEIDSAGPDEQRAPWVVEFLLQDSTEPSVIVPADEVWQARAALPAVPGLAGHPPEFLLADLGRASMLWPRLEDALHHAYPTAVTLNDADACGELFRHSPRPVSLNSE